MVNNFFLKGSLNPINALRVIKYNIDFKKNNPDYFAEDGITIFTGAQGSGKTISAVQMVRKLCQSYPKAVLVTNTKVEGIQNKTYFAPTQEDMIKALVSVSNDYFGVIYFIDEIQLLLNSLESKNIPLNVIAEISQQRRQRKIIIGTSQLFGRLAKALREQVKYVILCRKIGFLQYNIMGDNETAVEKDGKLSFEKMKRFFWFHSVNLYNAYDTFGKLKSFIKGSINNNFKVDNLNFERNDDNGSY